MGNCFINLLCNSCPFDDAAYPLTDFTNAFPVLHLEKRELLQQIMKLWCLADHSFIGFGSDAEALRDAYPINSGEFSQVGAFPPNSHELCFVNILKTKHKGTHMSLSFNRTDCSLTAIASLHLSSLDGSFRARRGSGTRLLKQGLFEHKHERSRRLKGEHSPQVRKTG